MTWFGWLLVVDLAFSSVAFIATNRKRKPLSDIELAFKVVNHIVYLALILAIGTGSL